MNTKTYVRKQHINSQRLRELRGDRSAAGIAAQIGLTRQHIWNYENGMANPPINVLAKLAEIYEVPIESLLEKEIS